MTHSSDFIPKGKNSLTIRLTESAVFLRSDSSIHHRECTEDRPTLLRGLLILNLAKPTKISGIDVELVGKTEAAWPEGIGARRVEVTEEHCFFRASTIYFEAGKAHSRRTASIGPGVAYATEYDSNHDDWEELHTTSLRYHRREREEGADSERNHTSNGEFPPSPPRHSRNVSVDASHYHRYHVSYHEEHTLDVPPYSPYSVSPHTLSPPLSSSGRGQSPAASPNHEVSPAQSLEEFRAALNRERNPLSERSSLNPAAGVSPPRSPLPSHRSPNTSVSRRPSMDDALEDDPERVGSSRDSHRGSRTPQLASPHPGDRDRGRRKGRFTLAAVSNAFMDAVRSSSPILTRSRERSRDDFGSVARGRTMEKRLIENVVSPRASLHQDVEVEGSRSRAKHPKENLLDKVGEILRLDTVEHKESGRDWKEFKKGVYHYPISFQIPGNSPPTMVCDFGVVTWRLRAHVHRPGAFRPKYTAEREVIVVSCPTEDDTEDTENIIVERHWDQQMQYLIAISGRSFYIGGTLPVTFTMLPLAKASVHRVAVYLEERVDYYTNMRKIARTDPVIRFELICIRNQGKDAPPILPLDSDDPEAFQKSPLYGPLASQLESEDDISEMASSFMGPGPWTFHVDLKLPQSCSVLKPTNRNKRAGMIVSHLLKIVMRMERGDKMHLDKHGKKKLFDIVVQMPVHILSCRCNPEWISLPRYSESINKTEQVIRTCPCRTAPVSSTQVGGPFAGASRAHLALERVDSRESTDSSVSAADDQPVNPALMPSLRRPQIDDLVVANTLFERLVSGQESEMGESPPAYEAASPRQEPLPRVNVVDAS